MLLITSTPALGPTQPPVQWVTGALSLGIKWPGHEAEHTLPSSAEVKNVWSCISTPPYVFLAWWLVKQRICLNGVVLIKHRNSITLYRFAY
jgi:hypothetical protein